MKTPETDDLARGNHVVPTEWAEQLERERDEARDEINIIRNTLSKNGEAVGNGEHDFSIIEMVENLMQSKDYFVRKSDSLERERDEAREKYDTLATEHMLVVNKLCEERDEAQSEIQRLRFDAQREAEHHDRMVGELEKVYTERDDALEKVKELIYIADRAIALADIDFENDKFGVVSELRSDLEKIKKSK